MRKANTQIVPATAELLTKFYGSVPRTIRGVVAVRDDEVLGVAGIYVDHERLVVFSELNDELRQDRRSIVRGIRAVLKLIESAKLPVIALADESIDKADSMLTHMGFSRNAEGLHQWHG